MHFYKIAFSLAAAAAVCSASPVPQDIPVNSVVPPSTESAFNGQKGTDGKLTPGDAPGEQTDQALQKKQVVTAIVTLVGEAAISAITEMAINAAADFIKNLSQWNEAREEFTKQTTLEMWNRNPDYTKYHAAICYNKGYRLNNTAGITELQSAKLELGQLNTDYDCMFMDAPNQFFTDSDGGFINLSYRYDDHCSFDQDTGDLTCT